MGQTDTLRESQESLPKTVAVIGCFYSLSPFFHEGKSALDVIYANRDFAKLEARSDTPKLEPAIDVVRMPETKYVLVMETSSSMSR